MIRSNDLELVFKKHKTWVNIVHSFGCNVETSEDLVQEMYVKIHLKLEDGLDIIYADNEINYYYIFKTLRTLFLDLKRKENKVEIVELKDLDQMEVDVDYNDTYEMIQKELSDLYWYDRKIYEIIDSGSSIADLSRKTKIPYFSLYNTYKKVKLKLKELI